MNVHERFDAWILRAKLSGSEVARRLDTHRSYVSHLRKGRQRPGLAMATKIEALTGIPARDWAEVQAA